MAELIENMGAGRARRRLTIGIIAAIVFAGIVLYYLITDARMPIGVAFLSFLSVIIAHVGIVQGRRRLDISLAFTNRLGPDAVMDPSETNDFYLKARKQARNIILNALFQAILLAGMLWWAANS